MTGTPRDKQEAEEAEAPLDPIDEAASAGDVDALLALARAHRVGTNDTPKDLARCMAAYRAAAALGSAEAEYALALFHLTGGVVAQDLEKATGHLRKAADAGSVAAKVYVANLYELGIYYERDAEKADVFYRSAARAANVRDAATSEAYEQRLAELGSVRHGLALLGRATSEAERTRLLRKMRAYGYQLHERRQEKEAIAVKKAAPAPEPAPEREPEPESEAPLPKKSGGAGFFLLVLALIALAAGGYVAYSRGYLKRVF
ncbi:hypothetical protein LZC95_37210 [Pendulispora brunnea]|uniref:HCP-like protein n=1 Tax=Pendulispora brunnea TaxID=2905690 RepID=A0ABZ2K3E6_9BACT